MYLTGWTVGMDASAAPLESGGCCSRCYYYATLLSDAFQDGRDHGTEVYRFLSPVRAELWDPGDDALTPSKIETL
jgi:hypothetical protein